MRALEERYGPEPVEQFGRAAPAEPCAQAAEPYVQALAEPCEPVVAAQRAAVLVAAAQAAAVQAVAARVHESAQVRAADRVVAARARRRNPHRRRAPARQR